MIEPGSNQVIASYCYEQIMFVCMVRILLEVMVLFAHLSTAAQLPQQLPYFMK